MAPPSKAVNRVAGVARKHAERVRGETIGCEANELIEGSALEAVDHRSLAVVTSDRDARADRAERRRLQEVGS
jgi:hypothetical protein